MGWIKRGGRCKFHLIKVCLSVVMINPYIQQSFLVKNGVRLMATIPSGKLDQIIPPTVDFPARHIGPRKHDVRYNKLVLSYKLPC